MSGTLNPQFSPRRVEGRHRRSPAGIPSSGENSTLGRHPGNMGALLVVIALFALPIAGNLPATNPNEVARIELAVAAAHWSRLDIGPAAHAYGLSEDVARRQQKIYSDKAPGLSLSAVPFVWILDPALPRQGVTDLPAYWPLRHALTLILVALPSAGLALFVASMVPSPDSRRRAPLLLMAALATPLWTYATVFFGHIPAALLITVGWVLLLRGKGGTDPRTRWLAAAGGAATGLAVTTEYPTILLAVVIFGTLLIRRTPLPVLFAAGIGAVAGILPALVYHHLAFGAPWLTGYAFKAHADFQAIHGTGVVGISWPTIEGLWGVLFSPRRGLFYFSPLLLIAPLGVKWMVRREGWRDVAPAVVAIAVYTLFAAGFTDWEAGWCAAARHLVPVVPLMTIFALSAAAILGARRWGRVVLVVLVALSGINTFLTIAVSPFFPPQFNVPLGQLVLPSIAEGVGFPNLLGSTFGTPNWMAVMAAGLGMSAALGWALMKMVPGRSRWIPLLVAATIAAQLVMLSWQGTRRSDEQELLRTYVLERIGSPETAQRIDQGIPNER